MIKNNKTFKGLPDLEEAPKPIIIEDKDNRSNTDDERDPELEESFDFKYYFPSLGEPNDEHGTFEYKSAFASALMKGQTPTLMFHPESFFGERDVPLQAIFPIQFPYGIGVVKEKIPINVSEIECLKHFV